MIQRHVEIQVLDETWSVPYGFGKAYSRAATDHIEFNRTGKPERLLESVSGILGLVGYEASPAVIASWPLRRRVEAQVYCGNLHVRASDNPVPRCPKPEWLPEPWCGPERGDDIFGGRGPTPLRGGSHGVTPIDGTLHSGTTGQGQGSHHTRQLP